MPASLWHHPNGRNRSQRLPIFSTLLVPSPARPSGVVRRTRHAQDSRGTPRMFPTSLENPRFALHAPGTPATPVELRAPVAATSRSPDRTRPPATIVAGGRPASDQVEGGERMERTLGSRGGLSASLLSRMESAGERPVALSLIQTHEHADVGPLQTTDDTERRSRPRVTPSDSTAVYGPTARCTERSSGCRTPPGRRPQPPRPRAG